MSAEVLGDVNMSNLEFLTIPNAGGLAARWLKRGARKAGEAGEAGQAGEAGGAG